MCLAIIILFVKSPLIATSMISEQSLISFSSGAILIDKPGEYSASWSGIWILDEDPETGWCSPEGEVSNHQFVIELAEETVLHFLEFDTGSVDAEGSAARDILVELSNEGPKEGFQEIARVSLAEQQDHQGFPVTGDKSGKWLRLSLLNNHSSPDYTELMDFRAYGEQLTQTPLPDVSGTYETNYNDFHLLQQGTSVTGCYEYNEGVLNGGIEGRIMKFTWQENIGRGPAVMVFTPGGERFFGLWWYEGDSTAAGEWNGVKKSQDVGGCPHWAGGIKEQMTKELLETGRVRLYGINFDYDSDIILAESKPTLDQVVTLLNVESALQLIIEGHTDSEGTSEHNQVLSQKRAEAVKLYLVTAGIGASRLSVEGYGESQPVASNNTPVGRAQNRRVELVVKK